ncbi:hypothetical protein KAT92_03290 [Candidatus Babeliales bacterium]|nr:hypothetical protein [Candidatus Babeliales bacterium]
MTIFMFTFLLFPAYNAHKAFEKKEYEKAKDILQTVQVEKPNDPLLNYNLGVIDYKKKNFDAAKQNFSRAATSAFSSNDKELLEKAYFNLGNSFYQNARKILVEDWEKSPPDGPAPDEAVRNQAISETKSAIKKYDKILEIKQNQKQAQTNKKASEAFLQKLIKQQQEEKKKENKKDKKDKKDK